MIRLSFLLVSALALTSCASQIELPGSVLPPEVARVAVADMGPPVDWRSVDAATGEIENLNELIALADDFPDSASVRRSLMRARFATSDDAGMLQDALWLTRRTLEPGASTQRQLLEMYSGSDRAALEKAFAQLPTPLASSVNDTGFPLEIRLPESAMWDAQEGRMLVTSIVSRGLYALDLDGDWREVPIANAGSLAGIALDAPRGLIWVASGVVHQTPDPDTAFRGVIALDRITLAERRRVAAPRGATISDIAIGPDGTVYGSDPLGGGVYSATISQSAMQAFIAPGTFRSPQGIAVRRDNSSLYISDYRYGLAQVMLRSRHVYRMRAAEPMLLDGVDGLWLHGNHLIAVQNGLRPHRITSFELGEGIGVIASHRVLERANPAWIEPLGGAITGDTLYYIGNGQWDFYDQGGAVAVGAQPSDGQVHALQLVETPAEQP